MYLRKEHRKHAAKSKTKQNKKSTKGAGPRSPRANPTVSLRQGEGEHGPERCAGQTHPRAPARDALPALRFPRTVQPHSLRERQEHQGSRVTNWTALPPSGARAQEGGGGSSVSIRCTNQHPRNEGLTADPPASRGVLSASMRRALCSLCA